MATKMTPTPHPEAWSTTPGVYLDVPHDTYHADREAVSKSQLDRIRRSPAHYRHALDHDTKDTPSLVLGRALHTAVLEPDLFDEEFAVQPVFKGTGSVKARAEWQAEHAHLTILTETQLAHVQAMREALMAEKRVRWMLEQDAWRETTFVFRHDEQTHDTILRQLGDPTQAPEEHTDLFVRTRCDLVLPERGIWVDLKTTTDASAWAFSKAAHDYRYHVQAAIYQDAGHIHGIPPQNFAFVAVEKEPPHVVTVFDLADPAIELGRIHYLEDLRTLHACQVADIWPGYHRDIVTLDLPTWAYGSVVK